MKILGFAGSNSTTSINKKLVEYVSSFFNNDTIEIIDLNDFEMPLYGIDQEELNGIPELAYDFAKKIDNNDLLIISLAENNGSYSVAFKNIYDWISRIPNRKTFGQKPVFLMATSPGTRGGMTVLEFATNLFPHSGGTIVQTFSLPSFNDNFYENEGIVDHKLKTVLLERIAIVKNKFL